MTRVAYISDLHLEHRQELILPAIEGRFDPFKKLGFPETLDADLLCVAGDTHPNHSIQNSVRKLLANHYGIPVVMVPGNHDFYNSTFPTHDHGMIQTVAGITVASATLWTRLNPYDELLASDFPDFKFINDIDTSKWIDVHLNQLETLRKARADLIVTHHAPTQLSIHARYATSNFNGFYANNIDMELFEGVKLWIHGHVHDPHDYVYKDVRVVCNPVGYPFEKRFPPPKVEIVEI